MNVTDRQTDRHSDSIANAALIHVAWPILLNWSIDPEVKAWASEVQIDGRSGKTF